MRMVKMVHKLLLTFAVFVLFALATGGVGALVAPGSVGLPQAILSTTPCPVAGCTQADGACHAAAAAPVMDGSFSMTCPKVLSCTDVRCHAEDRLTSHFNKPDDTSMNLWILAPVVLTLGLVLLVKKMR